MMITVAGIRHRKSWRTAVVTAVVAVCGLGLAPAAHADGSLPLAPYGVDGTRADGAVTVQWYPGYVGAGPDPDWDYVVTASPGGATCTAVALDDVYPQTCTVDGLTDGVAYTFTVVAQNANGFSPPSAPSPAITPSATPPTVPAAPESCEVIDPNYRRVLLGCAPGDAGGSPITAFQYSENDGATWQLYPYASGVLVDPGGDDFVFRFVNAIGPGPASAVLHADPEYALPVVATDVHATAGTSSAGTTSADVTWTAPTYPSTPAGEQAITYVVTASPGGQTCTTRYTDPSSCTVTGLTQQPYTFTVTGTNPAGSTVSAPSDTVIPAAPMTPPAPVTTTPAAPIVTTPTITTDSPVSVTVVAAPVPFVAPSLKLAHGTVVYGTKDTLTIKHLEPHSSLTVSQVGGGHSYRKASTHANGSGVATVTFTPTGNHTYSYKLTIVGTDTRGRPSHASTTLHVKRKAAAQKKSAPASTSGTTTTSTATITTTTAPTSTGTYTNVNGVTVSDPVAASSPPAGATAQCADGTYSFSLNHSGTCSHHGGVAAWL